MRWIIICCVGIVVLATGSVLLWKVVFYQDSSNRSNPNSQQTLGTATDATSSSSDLIPLQTINSGQTAANNPSPNNASTPVDQQQDASIKPEDFKQYEKYKDAQSTLLADLTKGAGAEAASGKKVSVYYRGWLTSGQIFDENTDTQKPFTFTIGTNSVIPGFEQGIAGMKEGGERLIIIPPVLGYGSQKHDPIPANSVLIFDVKLIKVQ